MENVYTLNVFILLLSIILSVIGTWKLFSKFGEPGWKSLIPIYSDYMLFKIFWEPKQFWKLLGLNIGVIVSYICTMYSLLFVMFLETSSMVFWIGWLLLVIFSIWSLVLHFRLCRNISENCGKGMGTTIGLFLMMPIFLVWLGFTADSEPHFESFHQVEKD